jgi:hypothetical protein
MPKMVLVGGEKDGLGQDGELSLSAKDRPNVFYAVPNVDDEKIRNAKGNQYKHELRDKLAVLAYQYDPYTSTTDVFYMDRTPALDKVSR